MKKVKKITKEQFIEMLKNWKYGAQPVSVQYVTSPKLNKLGKSKFGNVIKIANVGGMIGYVYENSVNNQKEREGKERDFLAQSLWKGKGKRLSTALSMHIEKGKYYLTFKHQQTFKSFFFDSQLNMVNINELKSCFYDNTPKNQGVDEGNEIHHREILIDNIRKIKFRKTTYEIVG